MAGFGVGFGVTGGGVGSVTISNSAGVGTGFELTGHPVIPA